MSEVEFLDVYSIDAGGRPAMSVLFDPTALDAAYAELDARYDTGEAASHPRAAAAARAMALAWTSRDWDALQALCAPSFAHHDHRLLGWGRCPTPPRGCGRNAPSSISRPTFGSGAITSGCATAGTCCS